MTHIRTLRLQPCSPKSVIGLAIAGTLAVIVSILLATPAHGERLSLQGVLENPTSFSAHESQELCFITVDQQPGNRSVGVTFITLEGPAGEVGGKPGLADGTTRTCISVPAIENAGAWNGCTPPKDVIHEAYLVSVRFDSVGLTSEEARFPDENSTDAVTLKVQRLVTQKDPRPEECTELDGDWTWTFNAGVLECAKLPMKVTLPGFPSSVTIETDGNSDTEGLRMTVTGDATGERLVLIRQGDKTAKGKEYPAFAGGQDISKLLQERKPIRGKYSLVVLDSNTLQGQLDVEKASYQGDICSIFWPFHAARKSGW